MTAAAFQQLLASVRKLTPPQRDQLRRELQSFSMPGEADAGDAFAKKLVELGIGTPRRPGPCGPNPQPVLIEGSPLSEQLIRERR